MKSVVHPGTAMVKLNQGGPSASAVVIHFLACWRFRDKMKSDMMVNAIVMIFAALSVPIPSNSAPATSPTACHPFTENRVDCSAGDSKISESNCIARGCCYDGSTTGTNTTCYYAVPGVPVTTIHVVRL